MEPNLSDLLLAHVDPGVRDRLGRASGLEAKLIGMLLEARESWEGVELGPEAFLPFLAARLTGENPLDDAHVVDLYLACGCAGQDEAAIVMFEKTYFQEIDVAVARAGASKISAPDLKQRIRQLLFVPPPEGLPKISGYAGRGSLRSWFRVTVTRMLLNFAKYQPGRKEVPVQDSLLRDLAPALEDPELAYLKKHYRKEFNLALQEAAGNLAPRQRNLLRYSLVDRLSIDRIGAIYGVHRATAARWLGEAREELSALTHRALAEKGIGQSQMASILKLIRSEMDVRLSQILGDGEAAGDG